MKALILNGSPRPQGVVVQALRTAADTLRQAGANIEWIDAHRMEFRPCTGCMQCRTTRRHPLNHLQNSCQFLSDEVLFLCTVFQLLYNAIGNLTSIQCLIFYEAGDDGNGYSSQEMILFLDELKESSNYYILKNIECQKKSNQNKGAAMLNE